MLYSLLLTCRRTILICAILIQTAFALWPFPSERFSGNSLLEAGSLGLSGEGRVVAFGDFNGDQFLDIVMLGSDEQILTVYLWDHDAFYFQSSTSFRHPQKVYNVIPGDFTHDGTPDLLVMSRGSSSSSLDMTLYAGSNTGGFDSNPQTVPSSSLAQPIPLDADGDLKIDLLGMTSESGSLKLWQNVYNGSQSNSLIFDVVDAPFHDQDCAVSNPHSNAVVDLNGDCLADVFLMCDEGSMGNKYFQIWTNEKAAGFSLAKSGRLPQGIQSISFADMDRDGTVDMVFVTCSSVSSSTGIGTDCAINIAFNQQLPLCTNSEISSVNNSKRVCRRPEQLCSADPNFHFDLSERANQDTFVSVPVSSLFPSTSGPNAVPSLLVLDTSTSPPIPIPLKLGDSNMDGFPDLLLIMSSPSNGGRSPKLLFSVPCAKGVIGCNARGQGRRGWHVVNRGAEVMSSIVDARGASFLDIDEDGTLDILVQRTGKQGQGTVAFVQNNFFFDAFFLKAIVLNGACDNGWCTRVNGNSTERYHPFGVSYSGATYKYTVLDTSGRRSAAQVGQLPQTSYQSLLTPYAFFGLGRTNNYIENLFVGSTKQSEQHFINMEGVIPNSKVVIYPPAGQDDGAWRRELYLRPGSWIPWVTLTVVATTVVLAIIVFVLRLNEKREDELERRRASHHINFDAL